MTTLEHFGVKGMKWGVHNGEVAPGASRRERKAANKESKLAYKEWKKEVGSEKVANEIFQTAVKTFGPAVKHLNNDPAFKGKDLTKDRYLRNQYDQHVSQLFNDHMVAASANRTITNTGRAMIYTYDSNFGMMRAQESQLVIHAEEGWPDFKAEVNELGQIVSLSRVDKTLKQSEDLGEAILEHYGVKGMKWGVHNADNTGTVSSKAAAAVNATKAKLKREIAERTDTEVHVRAKPGKLVRAVGGNRQLPHEDAVKARVAEQVAKRSTLDALSNKDLQHLVQRMNLEKQYREMAVKETRSSATEKFVLGVIKDHGDKAASKLGPLAAVGKKVVEAALNPITRNKALAGGSTKKKDNDN